MISEEDIKEASDAIDSLCTGHNDCPCTPLRIAIDELLTLRRRLGDIESFTHVIKQELPIYRQPELGEIQAVIYYLTEVSDGE